VGHGLIQTHGTPATFKIEVLSISSLRKKKKNRWREEISPRERMDKSGTGVAGAKPAALGEKNDMNSPGVYNQ
jgi:hypothetical protein